MADKSRFGKRSHAPAEKKSPPAWQWMVLVAIFIPILGFAIFMAVRQEREHADERATFGAVMAEYAGPPVQGNPGAARPALGKVVMVNADNLSLDNLHFAIPDDLRAWTPAEVTTVVQLRTQDREVGRYEGGGRALQQTVTVTVFDKASRVLLGSATFTG